MRKVKISQIFWGGENVLGPPGQKRLSKYLFRRSISPTSRGIGGGGPPPHTAKSKCKIMSKTKRLTEANRMNNKGPRGGRVLVHIEFVAMNSAKAASSASSASSSAAVILWSGCEGTGLIDTDTGSSRCNGLVIVGTVANQVTIEHFKLITEHDSSTVNFIEEYSDGHASVSGCERLTLNHTKAE